MAKAKGKQKKAQNDPMEDKILNDSSAYIKSIAEKTGRNVTSASPGMRSCVKNHRLSGKGTRLGRDSFCRQDGEE